MIDEGSSSMYGDHQSGVDMVRDDMPAAAEPLGRLGSQSRRIDRERFLLLWPCWKEIASLSGRRTSWLLIWWIWGME